MSMSGVRLLFPAPGGKDMKNVIQLSSIEEKHVEFIASCSMYEFKDVRKAYIDLGKSINRLQTAMRLAALFNYNLKAGVEELMSKRKKK